ncbi:MAG: tetratricopeptide repeat protein, partial [Planctomycetota bacterium]
MKTFLFCFRTILVFIFLSVISTTCLSDEPNDSNAAERKENTTDTTNTPKETPADSDKNEGQETNPDATDKLEQEDTVILRDGTVIKGKISDPGGPTIKIERKYGSLSVLKSDVKEYHLSGDTNLQETKNDIVYLNNGDKLVGKVKVENEANTIAIEIKKGESTAVVKLPRTDVLKIDWARDRTTATTIEDPLTARITALTVDLKSSDENKRKEAVEQLEKIGVFAVDYLRDIYSSQDENVKKLIDNVLFSYDLNSIVPARAAIEVPNVYERLTSNVSEEKLKCIVELLLIDEDITDLFVLFASREQEPIEVRNFCIYNLAKTEKNEEILKLLSSENARIRFITALYLADNNIPAGAMYLIDGLESKNNEVRQTAIDKLKKFTDDSFGYMADGTEENRKAAIKRWREWWEENEADLMNQSLKSLRKDQIVEEEQRLSQEMHKKAIEAWETNDINEAQQYFKKSLETDPSNIRAMITYGEFLFSALGNIKLAQEQLKRAIRRYSGENIDTLKSQAYYQLGLIGLSRD